MFIINNEFISFRKYRDEAQKELTEALKKRKEKCKKMDLVQFPVSKDFTRFHEGLLKEIGEEYEVHFVPGDGISGTVATANIYSKYEEIDGTEMPACLMYFNFEMLTDHLFAYYLTCENFAEFKEPVIEHIPFANSVTYYNNEVIMKQIEEFIERNKPE